MKIRNYIVLGVVAMFSSAAFSQIEISEETQEEVVPEKKEIDLADLAQPTTEFFAIANWSSTSRKLIENPANGGIFADPLGVRADETSLSTWSFGVGVRDRILPWLSWEGGISFVRNGESYLYEAADTSHTYTTTYSYIAMPIKALYTYGNKIRFYAGGGLVPQMFVRYRQESVTIDAVNAKTEESFTTQNGYRSFTLSAVANVGVQLSLGRQLSVLFMPEYRIQLVTSNVESSSYAHFGRALGFNMGLTYKL